jgi:RHS repeat-associated protein
VYGEPWPGAGPLLGYSDYNHWNSKKCEWENHASPAASLVQFRCEKAGAARPPGRCVSDQDNLAPCPDPCANFGSRPAPSTPGPIDLWSGSKLFEATDFENETGSLAVRRHYGSFAFGGSPITMLSSPVSAGNWRFGFSVELQLTSALVSGRVTVALPDGSLLAFAKQADGSLKPYTTSAYPVARTDYTLALSGTWPTAPNDLKLAPSTWILTGPQAVWTLTTKLSPSRNAYDIATPTSMVERQGPTWTFAYGHAGELTQLTDQFGNALAFEWIVSQDAAARPLAVSEIDLPDGRSIRYAYQDAQGGNIAPERLISVEWVSPSNVVEDKTTYVYGNDQYPTAITAVRDANDVVRRTVDYREDGRAVRSAAALGAEEYLVDYASASRTQTRTVTSPLGRLTTFQWATGSYASNSNLQTVTEAASPNAPASTESYTSANFRATSRTDAEGRVTTYSHDAIGRLTRLVEADGTSFERQTDVIWHPVYNVPTRVVRPGLTTDLVYDGSGRLTQRTLTDTTTIAAPYPTVGRTRTWTYAWTPTGLLASIDGPLAGTGDTISYAYDSGGYLTSVTNQVGQVTTITSRDWRGAPLEVEDENGTTTAFTYDIRGRPLSVTVDPGPTQSAYVMTYDAVGNMTRLILPEGGWLDYTYDAASRLVGIENDRGQTQIFATNALGQPTDQTVRNADSEITLEQTRAYDALGRVRQRIGGDAQTWSFGYDKVDNLIQMTDARAKVWNSGWDALDRIKTETDPETGQVEYGYAPNDAAIAFEDARDLATSRVVDGFGLTLYEASPDTGARTYWYDAADRLTRMIDADGVETVYSYDDAGRLLSETFPGSSADAVTYVYDSTAGGNRGVGHLTDASDPGGQSALIWDAQGRLATDRRTMAGQTYEVGYGYDANGDVTTMVYPSGRVVEIDRDPDGLITDITTRASTGAPADVLASDVAYAPFGPMTGLTHGNGLVLAQTYDQNYWLTGLEVSAPGVSRLDLTFTRDANGALTGLGDSASTARTAAFDYTDAGRLASAMGDWGNESYVYDAAGNRTEVRKGAGGGADTVLAITGSASNRIEEVRDGDGVLLRDLTWRDGGDLYQQTFASGEVQTLLYDARKRPVQFQVDGATVATFGYDYLGRRVSETTAGATTHYVFDAEGRVLAEHDGATGAVLREYVWLEDQPIALIATAGGVATTYYIHTGQIGEPLMLTDASQAVVWDAVVDPWGQVVMQSPASVALDLRLMGQWAQGASGLHQNWMRDYDPTLGRYVQADPLGLYAGQNLYAYVDGDPLNAVDPTGEIGVVGALVGAGLDLGLQLATNGGRIECVNWLQVGGAGVLGAIGVPRFAGQFALSAGRGPNAWKAVNAVRRFRRSRQVPRTHDVHHWAIPRSFEKLGPRAERIVNHPWNLNPIPRPTHQAIHETGSSWVMGWVNGVPNWAKAAQVSAGGGVTGHTLSRNCGC